MATIKTMLYMKNSPRILAIPTTPGDCPNAEQFGNARKAVQVFRIR